MLPLSGRVCRRGWNLLRFGAVVDVLHGVFDATDFFGLFVRDLEAELLFERHDQLDCIERISTEILDERSIRNDIVRIDSQLLDDDRFDSFLYRHGTILQFAPWNQHRPFNTSASHRLS